MKNFKNIISKISFALLILSLFSCSVNTKNNSAVVYETTAAYNAPAYGNAGFSRSAKVANMTMDSVAMAEMAVSDDADESAENGQKIIKTVDINAETRQFDESLEWIKKHVKEYDGNIDNSYVDTGNISYPDYRKNAHFTIRIPADKLDGFLNTIGDNLNVTFRNENMQDVTEEYDDTESRIKTLKIEEENLNELMKKAKSVEDMIKIEDKLSQVRSELQNISRRLSRLNNKIAYSTVNINITEVKDLTEVVETDDYSKENIVKQIRKNFEITVNYLKKQAVNIVVHLPQIVAVLIGILIILILVAILGAIFGEKEKATEKIKEDEVEVEIVNLNDEKANPISENGDEIMTNDTATNENIEEKSENLNMGKEEVDSNENKVDGE